MNISTIFKKPDFGLLIMRLILGASFATHGLTKFMGGTNVLEQVGKATAAFGIHEFPVFFGGMAALLELLGGILVFVGYKFRIGVVAILLVLFAALYSTFVTKPTFMSIAWPLEMFSVFLGLLFIGPGKYSPDKS